MYSSLSKARFTRNDFIHKGITPSYEESYSALISLIILVEVASKLNKVDFNRNYLEKYLSDNSQPCIPQIYVPKERPNKPLDVKYWREIRVIPGDNNWEGEFESFPDITLQPIKSDKV